MSEISGTFRDGRVELNAAVDWPDGLPVTVQPQATAKESVSAGDWREDWGIDDGSPDTPENRAEILRRMDAAEPLVMSPEEEQEWHAMLDWFGSYTLEAVKREMGLTR
jgi:hypothetical protein